MTNDSAPDAGPSHPAVAQPPPSNKQQPEPTSSPSLSRPEPDKPRLTELATECLEKTTAIRDRIQPCEGFLQISGILEKCHSLTRIFESVESVLTEPAHQVHVCPENERCVHELWHREHAKKVAKLKEYLKAFPTSFRLPFNALFTLDQLEDKLGRNITRFTKMQTDIELSWKQLKQEMDILALIPATSEQVHDVKIRLAQLEHEYHIATEHGKAWWSEEIRTVETQLGTLNYELRQLLDGRDAMLQAYPRE
ncbi:hypothetical protein FB45DRAFT_1052295 [Roridomyces roridus]|uniref:Uncharacterized protein n=1 Tax=Roridomyces roridus TaxID=1738132 RepID=A0AAD7CGG7_9AGAR|nr:hypothetical protein FB45DRAFT_1052295 [Roridomyces roridus]